MSSYVHGYSGREAQRLSDQAQTLEDLLHYDTSYPANSKVLEAGCGIGAQTDILSRRSPGANFISIDISSTSLHQARDTVNRQSGSCVSFVRGDLYNPPFADESFDHVFICFVLEHLDHPARALKSLRGLLKTNGSITVIEGDHGSCYFHPESCFSLQAWNSLISVQRGLGGNSLIGRQLYPLLSKAGFRDLTVSPRMVYSDSSRPGMMEGFVRRTIIPMVEGVETKAISLGLTNEASFRQGIVDLHKTAAPPDGVFCYTFFKAKAVK